MTQEEALYDSTVTPGSDVVFRIANMRVLWYEQDPTGVLITSGYCAAPVYTAHICKVDLDVTLEDRRPRQGETRRVVRFTITKADGSVIHGDLHYLIRPLRMTREAIAGLLAERLQAAA